MFNNEHGKALVILLTVILIMILVAGASRYMPAVAQMMGDDSAAGPMQGMQPGMQGMPGGMMGGMPGMMMPGMPGMMQPPSASIAVADGYVYVVQGNTLYQYNAKTLKLANKTNIATMPEGMRGGGQMPQMPNR